MTASGYSVSLQRAAARTIAAVSARLVSDRVPLEFKHYLDQVYAARSNGIQLDGQNIFLYRDAAGTPGFVDVEFGVGITAPFVAIGNVRPVLLPAGEVAMTAHVGPYDRLGAAHAAVVAWCEAHSRVLEGARWEVYGHWVEGKVPQTDIYYLLRPGGETSAA